MRGTALKSIFASLVLLGTGVTIATAQTGPAAPKLDQMLREILAPHGQILTPLVGTTDARTITVTVDYDGPEIKQPIAMEVSVSKPRPDGTLASNKQVMMKTIFLDELPDSQTISIATSDTRPPFFVAAVIKDSNRNVILRTTEPQAVDDDWRPKLELAPVIPQETAPEDLREPPNVETIRGTVNLAPKSVVPRNSTLHVQLLEDSLAGGLSMSLIAEQSYPLETSAFEIPFQLIRGLWDKPVSRDASSGVFAFKVWISDPAGRKIFVMNAAVPYHGSDLEYDIRLDALKQGKDTARGLNLNPQQMAQALVRGEARFDPVNGIPGEARLKILLSQDRGQYNRNPVLVEQTLILRGMETQIPFSLTTDSTNFDPYTPSPLLTVSLTDKFGRVYYSSGALRAQEGTNSVRLYPQ